MTMERYCRCSNCKDVYLYLSSGVCGYYTNHKDSKYCEECHDVIINALKKIPPKYKCIWVKTNDVVLEDLEKWVTDEKVNKLFRRLSFPLFRFGPKGHQANIREIVNGVGEFSERVFKYSYWENKNKKEEIEITEEVWLNIKTGETTPVRKLV